MILLLKIFQFSTLSHGNQRSDLLIKRLYETYSRDSLYISCHRNLYYFVTGIFAYKHWHFSNNRFLFYNYLFRNRCNNTSSANKSKSYLHINECCNGLEFQFISALTHSRFPPQSKPSTTLYVLNPPLPLGYNIQSKWLLVLSCSRRVKEGNFEVSFINKNIFLQTDYF
jgi:hypothetical protein